MLSEGLFDLMPWWQYLTEKLWLTDSLTDWLTEKPFQEMLAHLKMHSQQLDKSGLHWVPFRFGLVPPLTQISNPKSFHRNANNNILPVQCLALCQNRNIFTRWQLSLEIDKCLEKSFNGSPLEHTHTVGGFYALTGIVEVFRKEFQWSSEHT